MLVIDKIESLFGDNYLIKAKKVKELVQTELIDYSNREQPNGIVHFFQTPKKYKVGKTEFPLTLHATQMKNGCWWIQC
jgi:hypothetical protein